MKKSVRVKPRAKAKPVKKAIRQYKIRKVERYYGDMKAYVYKSKTAKEKHYFTEVFSEKNENDFNRLFESVSEKVKLSPLRYSKVKIIHLAVKGKARITKLNPKDDSDDSNEFDFWKASVKSLKKCNKKIFFQSLEKRKLSLKAKISDFVSGEMEYAGEGSALAEEYYLLEMSIYAELPKHDVKATKKRGKNKKVKNRNSRSRNRKNRR